MTPADHPARHAPDLPETGSATGWLKRLTPLVVSPSALAAVAIGASVYFLWVAYRANGTFGFPLDDPWIHLQFAKNLRTFGSFSYFRNEMVTSGSTAPLYTLLLAAGFLVSNNEMILSYVLGILAHAALTLATFFVARRLFDNVAAFGAALLVAIEPRLVHASVSGMETGLFMALLAASYLACMGKRPVWLGVLLGLALWTRPEGILFAAVLAADHFVRGYQHRRNERRQREPQKKRRERKGSPEKVATIDSASLRLGGNSSNTADSMKAAGAVFALFACLYLFWNLILSGSILPNTYAAKVRYYAGGPTGYLTDVVAFVSAGPRGVFAVFFVLGTVGTILDLIRRRSPELLVPVAWTILLIAAYGFTLPRLYQEGRYLMPLLPFFILVGVKGVLLIVRWAGAQVRALARDEWRKPVIAAILLVPLVQFGLASVEQSREYAATTKYITDRQVRTARWIADHLPPDAVVGTHDIGAIGFYSERKVVDMVGLVSPEMIRHIGSFDGLVRFLGSQHVTHLAVLRNWFEVASQTPLFQTDEASPEIMEVFTYAPYRTRFVGQEVSRAMVIAAAMLSAGRGSEAAGLLDQAARVEPACARLRFLAGCAAAQQGRTDRAEALFREALRLQPDHREAQAALADLLQNRVTRGEIGREHRP